MLSVAGGVIDRSVRHSAFRILPTVLQPTSADFIPQITFRIPHFLKLPIPKIVISLVVTDMANKLLSLSLSLSPQPLLVRSLQLVRPYAEEEEEDRICRRFHDLQLRLGLLCIGFSVKTWTVKTARCCLP